MPNFDYTARDSAGNRFSGTLQANSADEVTKIVRAGGKYLISVKVAADVILHASTSGGIKIKRDELIQFSNQLSIMLETGVTLAEALECCALNCEKGNLKKLLDDLAGQVNNGVDFSTALAGHPRSFPRLYVALIRASEKSGKMPTLLNRATSYLKDEQEILRKVKGAITYPGVMLGFAVLTTIFLLAFVLPRFSSLYANKGAALPLPTKILMGASNAITTHWMVLLPATIAAIVGIVLFLRSPPGKRLLDVVSLSVPLIGTMFRKLHLSRGLRTIGTMSLSGVSLVECVETAEQLCSNGQFNKLWQGVREQIANGKQFSEPLSQSRLVPGAVSRMLYSGEKGGKLAQVMEQVAGFAEHELKEKVTELTRYIEPAMILLMGLLIGGVVLAVLLPVLKISSVVSAG